MLMLAMKAYKRDRLHCAKVSLRTVEENIQRFKLANQSANQQVAERQAEDLRNKITLIEKLLKTKKG